MTSSIILELTNSRPYFFKAVGFYNDKNLLVYKDGETNIKLISGQFPPDEYNFFNTNSNRLYRFKTISGLKFLGKVYSIENCKELNKCQIIIHCSSLVKSYLFPHKPINSGYIEVLPSGEHNEEVGYIEVLPSGEHNEEPNGGVRTLKNRNRSRKHKSRRGRLTLRRNSIRNH